jgi:hypothetical protein
MIPSGLKLRIKSVGKRNLANDFTFLKESKLQQLVSMML